jgi:hypothetical protein
MSAKILPFPNPERDRWNRFGRWRLAQYEKQRRLKAQEQFLETARRTSGVAQEATDTDEAKE